VEWIWRKIKKYIGVNVDEAKINLFVTVLIVLTKPNLNRLNLLPIKLKNMYFVVANLLKNLLFVMDPTKFSEPFNLSPILKILYIYTTTTTYTYIYNIHMHPSPSLFFFFILFEKRERKRLFECNV